MGGSLLAVRTAFDNNAAGVCEFLRWWHTAAWSSRKEREGEDRPHRRGSPVLLSG